MILANWTDGRRIGATNLLISENLAKVEIRMTRTESVSTKFQRTRRPVQCPL